MNIMKSRKILILALFLISFIILNPLHSVITHSYLKSDYKPTPAQIPRFKIGVTGSTGGNWDPTVYRAGFSGSYITGTLEYLMEPLSGWSGEYDDLDPVLATNWTLFNWSEEMNYHPTDPFINTGGLMALELTLREGVTFHDGSAWNATVAKWNLDRTMVITGNITGKLTAFDTDVYQARFSYWLDAVDWADYETDSWNVSQYIGQPATYAEHGTSGEAAMNGKYCRIKNVTIIDDLASGGTIRINFGDWGGANSALQYVYSLPMISMDAYQNYFDLPIYGLGGEPGFPQPDISGGYPSIGFPGHLIGTGPYIFIEHDELILQEGSMKINPNWWNSTAMQAQGWHQIPEIGVVTFPYGTAGFTARNLAMVTGTIDLAYDDSGGPLDYNAMIADSDINYFEMGSEPTRTSITLNAINETEWKTWADLGPAVFDASDPAGPVGDMSWMLDIDSDGTIHTDGINRALRKALSYSYDYDTFIDVVLEGRAARSGGFLGIGNEFYNPSIPIAYRNLTIARKALIDDPVWGLIVAARNLDINNATADWIWVANNDPIFEFKLLWDQANIDIANIFSTSIKDIGIVCGGPFGAPDPAWEISPDLYTVMFSQTQNFPWFTYHGVPTNWPDSNVGSLPYLEYYYKSPGLPFVNGSGKHFPYEAFYNMGFHYNLTVDDWLARGWFSDRTTMQEIMNNMTTHFQTYQYSEIFISHSNWGIAIDKDWVQSYHRGTAFQFIKYIPPPPPPGDIALSSNAGTPDIDGDFNLIWNISLGADNYSIYMYDNLITEINGSLTLIANKNGSSPLLISGVFDGEYYFVAVAHNLSGDTISNNVHITVQRPPPGDIALSSDAGTPDIDGDFNLIWNISLGAENYSIYSYNSEITQINGSLTSIAFQNATSSFPISGLPDGEYYFIVVAHNQKGDTMSNNINVTVQKAPILPSSFVLSSDADVPDDNGLFDLIWTSSDGADNYSIYMYNNMITEINGSLTIIANQTATSPHLISGLTDGDFYFVAVAYNQYGNTTSNNVHITVLIPPPPSSFVLSSDAGFPDDDGLFDLSWTSSIGADNYSLYMDNNIITVIDSDITLLLDQIAISPFLVSGLPNGEYYFVIVAHNQFGDTMSNNVHVTVNVPGEAPAPAISSYNTVVLMGITVCTTIILFKKVKKKYKR